jgi:Xaa-Pro dipeptidase
MFNLERIRRAIRGEHLNGWLFYNRLHNDRIADRILDIPADAVNTRPWLYLVPAEGEPVRLVHAVEDDILDRLPGGKIVYRGREEWRARVKEAASGGGRWGAGFSLDFPRYSTLDHGTALELSALGLRLASADNLILNTLSVLNDEELHSHEQACRDLHLTVERVWERIVSAVMGRGQPLYEGDVLAWIMELFDEYGLETDGPLIVGAGRHTRLPHYFPEGRGDPLLPGQVIQLDIWGRKRIPGSIFADISWSGVLAPTAPEAAVRAFQAVCRARDAAVSFLKERLAAGGQASGAEVDRTAVASLVASGFGQFIRHRTGHSIDTEVHGSGVNIDAVEQPDHRPLREGSCFSVEPGVYLDDFGVRTEIDVYIKSGRPVISGGVPQRELLLVKE